MAELAETADSSSQERPTKSTSISRYSMHTIEQLTGPRQSCAGVCMYIGGEGGSDVYIGLLVVCLVILFS